MQHNLGSLGTQLHGYGLDNRAVRSPEMASEAVGNAVDGLPYSMQFFLPQSEFCMVLAPV